MKIREEIMIEALELLIDSKNKELDALDGDLEIRVFSQILLIDVAVKALGSPAELTKKIMESDALPKETRQKSVDAMSQYLSETF